MSSLCVGAAGVTAAVQVGRAGARAMLIEKQAQLGGTTTTGGVNAIRSFFAYGRQVIAGIGWKLVCRTAEVLGQPAPDGSRYGESHGVTMRHQRASACSRVLPSKGASRRRWTRRCRGSPGEVKARRKPTSE